ncbi:MAG TPA: glycosyltransferase [Chloroflexota bacterium]|nr:glycosyltransferase [Chloroflexota bacterium]
MSPVSPERAAPRRLAYVVWRFPKLSETFILREIEELERLGWEVDVFAHVQTDEKVRHPEAERWLRRTTYRGRPGDMLLANLTWLRDRPGDLLWLYGRVVHDLWREPGELARGLMALFQAALWARAIRRRGIGHVHAHFARHPAVAALAMARLAGVSYSFTGHSQDVHRYTAMQATKVRHARFVVVIAHFLRDQYIARRVSASDLAKVHVIRCGVDVAQYRSPPHDRGDGPVVLLTVARLIEFKGLIYLIEACRLLVERGHDVRCHIIGDGPLRAELQRRVDWSGLGGRVVLHGPKPQAEVRRVLADPATVVPDAAAPRASMFVLPSIVGADRSMEGVPVSLMEAMASGLPVVATRTGGIRELVEHGRTGLLVEQKDATALADAIARLAGDVGLARRLAAAGRQKVEAEFDLRRNVERLSELFAHACDGVSHY